MSRAIVFGTDLENKGGQAMAYLVIAGLREAIPDIQVSVLSGRLNPALPDRLIRHRKPRQDKENFAFDIGWGPNGIIPWKTVSRGKGPVFRTTDLGELKRGLVYRYNSYKARQCFADADIYFDVSGFAFGAQWGYLRSQTYLSKIAALKELRIPTYLLPQSFGPFEYSSEQQTKRIKEWGREILKSPRMVCAREADGMERISALCPDARVSLEEDMVLQSANLNPALLFRDVDAIPKHPSIETDKNVGIVPNVKTMRYLPKDSLLEMYRCLVNRLLDHGCDVYIIRHATEDGDVCTSIAEMFDTPKVHLLNDDCYSFQYEELFSSCQFLIASRYHAIVHAYRRGTPCIALGWATKYGELLNRFDQGDFNFDLRESNVDDSAIRSSVDRMVEDYQSCKTVIQTKLSDIQAGPSIMQRAIADYQALTSSSC